MSKASQQLAVIDVERLHGAVAMLSDAHRQWSSPEGENRLAMALEACKDMWSNIQLAISSDRGDLPVEIKNNLLIVSVYAEGKLIECELSPSREKLASLIMMMRNLVYSLREWRAAA